MKRFLINFPLGVFLGVSSVLLLVWILDSQVGLILEKYAIYFFSLAATLLAATLAVSSSLNAIENQNHLAEQKRIRSLSATKAFMPIATSEMCKVARHGMVYNWNIEDEIKKTSLESFRDLSVKNLRLSDETVENFRSFIEFSHDEEGEKVAIILREYQVLFSRWQGRFESGSSSSVTEPRDKIHAVVHWAYLYALTSALFRHARGQNERIDRPTYSDEHILNALHISGILITNEQDFQEDIDRFQSLFDEIYNSSQN